MEGILKTFDLVPFDVPMIVIGGLAFVIFYVLMKGSVFEPFLALVEAREAATEGATASASADLKAAAALEHEFEEKILEAREAALNEKSKKLEAARKDASAILAEAESKAQNILKDEREKLQTNIESLRAETMGRAQDLVNVIVSKLESPSAGGNAF